MDETSVRFMDEQEHLDYPRQCVSAELDILDLEQIIGQFASQHTHPTARLPENQAFHVRLFPRNGRGEKFTLQYGELIPYFRANFTLLNEMKLRFFFMVQPGGWNRIWMPCMQILLSIFNVNPSFAWLVGKRHVSSFGSYVRMVDNDDDEMEENIDHETSNGNGSRGGQERNQKVPRIFETWWSMNCPKYFRNGEGTSAVDSLDDGQRHLFDVESYDIQSFEGKRLAAMIYRPSVCVQYDFRQRSSTIIVLDEGPSFLNGMFRNAMLNREQLGFNEDPFSIHALILSEVLNDWTFSFEAMQLVINEMQSRVFGNEARREEYEQISKSLHELITYQLRYQNSITAIPRVLESLRRAHHRFEELGDVPGYVFQRVEDVFERMILQAHSNRDHCMRMEQQIKNIQTQLIDLTNLEMESQIRRNTQTVNDLIRRLEDQQGGNWRHRGRQVPGGRAGPTTPAVPAGVCGPELPPLGTEDFPALSEMVTFGREQSIALREQGQALVRFAEGAEAQNNLLKNVAITSVLFLVPNAITSTFGMEIFHFPDDGGEGKVIVNRKALIIVVTTSACFLGALAFAMWHLGYPALKPYLQSLWPIQDPELAPQASDRNSPRHGDGNEGIQLQELQNNARGEMTGTSSPQQREQINTGVATAPLAVPRPAHLPADASPTATRSPGSHSGLQERARQREPRPSASTEVEPYVNGDSVSTPPAVQARHSRRDLVAEYDD